MCRTLKYDWTLKLAGIQTHHPLLYFRESPRRQCLLFIFTSARRIYRTSPEAMRAALLRKWLALLRIRTNFGLGFCDSPSQFLAPNISAKFFFRKQIFVEWNFEKKWARLRKVPRWFSFKKLKFGSFWKNNNLKWSFLFRVWNWMEIIVLWSFV